jgi:hypothetical protein
MKVIKIIDCVAQVILIAGSLMAVMINGLKISDESTFGVYFLVGGWQMISVFVHLVAGKEYGSKTRRVYYILLLCTLGMGLLVSVGAGIIYFLGILLLWSPVLAILYMTACILETKKQFEPVAETGSSD